jgi:hypothetical protein
MGVSCIYFPSTINKMIHSPPVRSRKTNLGGFLQTLNTNNISLLRMVVKLAAEGRGSQALTLVDTIC